MLRHAAGCFRRSFLPRLVPSPEAISIPAAYVSGTAKGKGKLKTGQVLKRSKIPKKKAPSGGGGGGGRSKEAERISRTVESCLNAPCPVRHLKPKDRWREAEREKLGLVSKERQREIDMDKEKKKKPAAAVAANAAATSTSTAQPAPWIGTPGLNPVKLGLIDEKDLIKYELTVEDGRRLAKEYSSFLMKETRKRQAAESALLNLKKEAIAALPDNLREAALLPDMEMPPEEKAVASMTPPVEGYLDMMRESALKYAVRQKLR